MPLLSSDPMFSLPLRTRKEPSSRTKAFLWTWTPTPLGPTSPSTASTRMKGSTSTLPWTRPRPFLHFWACSLVAHSLGSPTLLCVSRLLFLLSVFSLARLLHARWSYVVRVPCSPSFGACVRRLRPSLGHLRYFRGLCCLVVPRLQPFLNCFSHTRRPWLFPPPPSSSTHTPRTVKDKEPSTLASSPACLIPWT